MTHIHSWRRFKGNKFICCGPKCYHKIELFFLDGKLAECPKCKKTFIVLLKDVPLAAPLLVCPNCAYGAYELTVEGRLALLNEITDNKLEELYQEKFESLNKREVQLDNRARDLDLLNATFARRSQNIEDGKARFLEEYRAKLDQLLEQQRQLKASRKTLALELQKRRNKLRDDKLKFEEEKVKYKTGKVKPEKQTEIQTEAGPITHDALSESINITLTKILEDIK